MLTDYVSSFVIIEAILLDDNNGKPKFLWHCYKQVHASLLLLQVVSKLSLVLQMKR